VTSPTSNQKAASDDTPRLIIEAARAHLRQFGPDKVTVVDIARSLGMSHANVYRFFKSKAEILDAVIDDWLARVESFIEGVAAQPGTAADRLEAVVMAIHRRRRTKFEQDPQVYLTFRRLIEARPDAVAKREEKIIGVFKRIIQEGINAKEFAPVDTNRAARAMGDATAMFLHPAIMPATLNSQSEERIRCVIKTMCAGLSTAKMGSGITSSPLLLDPERRLASTDGRWHENRESSMKVRSTT